LQKKIDANTDPEADKLLARKYSADILKRCTELSDSATTNRINATQIKNLMDNFVSKMKTNNIHLDKLQTNYTKQYQLNSDEALKLKTLYDQLQKKLADIPPDLYTSAEILALMCFIPGIGVIPTLVLQTYGADVFGKMKAKRELLKATGVKMALPNALLKAYSTATAHITTTVNTITNVKKLVIKLEDTWVSLVTSLTPFASQGILSDTVLISFLARIKTLEENWTDVNRKAEKYLTECMVSMDVQDVVIEIRDMKINPEDLEKFGFQREEGVSMKNSAIPNDKIRRLETFLLLKMSLKPGKE
jgi:hypothetical protein